MRGNYNLKDWEIDYWTPKIKQDVDTLIRSTDLDDIDYTSKDLNPYQMGLILEGLGWESEEFETTGWEQDRWEYFSHPDYDIKLCLFSCGITFEMKILLQEKYI